MSTSEARILANRANAQKSTGPRTDEGKAISRRNGLKHGMAGAGIVLPEAVETEVAIRARALQAELAPKSPLGQILIQQMASTSVLMERATQQREAATAHRVFHAIEEFDHARLDEADTLLEAIGENPRGSLRKLQRTPEGVERLILAWQDLRADLTLEASPTWSDWHRDRAAHLLGFAVDQPGAAFVRTLAKAIGGDVSGPTDPVGSVLDAEGRKAEARSRMVERIDEEIAALEADYEAFDFEAIAIDRSGAADRALFDPSPEATRARRYAAEATRGFFNALKEFRAAEAEAAEKEAIANSPFMRNYGHLMGSGRDRVGPTPPPARTAVGPVGPRVGAPLPGSTTAPASPVARPESVVSVPPGGSSTGR